MIHLLRHTAFRLWITIFVGGICILGVLPPLQAVVGLDALPFVAVLLLVVLFMAIGWAANRFGLGRVHRLMRSADLADREGLRAEAEEAFRSALAVLDGVLIAPAARRRTLLPLAARVARFYLSQTRLSAVAESLVTGYLSANPGDEEAAEQWVRHAEQQGGLREEHQDLAARLGGAHPGNEAIQHGLARLYLMLERTDYPALHCYRRVCGGEGRVPKEFCADLARLLRKEGRSDDWAQQIYRQALLPPPAYTAPLAEVGPDLSRIRIEEAPEPEIEMPDAVEEVQGDEGFRIDTAATGPEEDEEEGRPYPLTGRGRGQAFVRRLEDFVSSAGQHIMDGLQRLGDFGQRAMHGMPRSKRIRAVLLGVLLAGIAGGGLWIAGHMIGVTSRAPDVTPGIEHAALAPAVVSDPYTLQVAAYLKQEYALQFVEQLKQQGLDAYYTETTSGGKRWYQVRISHFPDQQSAREFGRNLKWKGVVDDFYVTNYVR